MTGASNTPAPGSPAPAPGSPTPGSSGGGSSAILAAAPRPAGGREGASASAPPAIEVRELSHRYPARRSHRVARRKGQAAPPAADRPALDRLSLTVEPGRIFGILGPNGGGKTTLFRILCTILRPTAGDAAIFGHSVTRDPHLVRRFIGPVFQAPSLDVKLSAWENLRHQGHLYGLRGPELDRRIEANLRQFGLLERAHDLTETYSGGMRRRAELAKALLHEPRLLLLDEPSTGLDPGARHDLWQQLQALRDQRGVTIALTTHLMEEADRCDRLAIVSQGRLVAVDSPANLKARIGGDVLTVVPAPQVDPEALRREIADRFGPWPEGGAPHLVDGQIHLEKAQGPAMVAELGGALSGRLASITVGRPTLEDVFLHLTGHAFFSATQP